MKDLTVYIAKTFVDDEEIAIGRTTKSFDKARGDADTWKKFTDAEAFVVRISTAHNARLVGRTIVYKTEKED